jgi:mannonate dehydratase
MLGQAGIAVMEPASPSLLRANIQGLAVQPYYFQGMYAGLLIDAEMPGWEERAGRGGYLHPAFNYKAAQAASPEPPADEAREQVWEDLITMYKQLIPVAESAGVLISQHGADPPVPSLGGRAQILYRFADFDRLFSEVPSPSNGMTFCVGTRYESGEDIFEGIKHFGGQGKIVHVHFRNVRGTLPKDQGYEERLVDDGDVDMMKVIRTLDQVGYDRALDYDHVVRTAGDSFIGRQSAAFAAGYIKGLLAGLA